jgi:hypothetical protein
MTTQCWHRDNNYVRIAGSRAKNRGRWVPKKRWQPLHWKVTWTERCQTATHFSHNTIHHNGIDPSTTNGNARALKLVTGSRELPTQIYVKQVPLNPWLAMLHAATFETRNSLSTLFLEKSTENDECILKTYDLFIYKDTHYTIILIVKKSKKMQQCSLF